MKIRPRLSADGDLMYGIPEIDLVYCRERLESVDRRRIPFTDILLFIGNLSLGAVAGAVVNGASLTSPLLFAFSLVGAATIALYGGLRHRGENAYLLRMKEALRTLPNPLEHQPLYIEYRKLAGEWNLESRTAGSNKTSSGSLTLHVKESQISISGRTIGESGHRLGEIFTEFVGYDPQTHRLVFIYMYSAINDNAQRDTSECIFSGTVSFASASPIARGNWVHLTGPPITGTATLTKDAI